VGVLHRPANRQEQVQPRRGREAALVAVVRDRYAPDQLHDELRPAVGRHPAVVDPGDVRVVHQGKCLPLRPEPGDDLPRVHPRLQDFDRHLTADRLGLLGQEHHAETALAALLHQEVRADDRAEALADWLVGGGGRVPGRSGVNAAQRPVGVQQLIDAGAEVGVADARLGQKRRPTVRGVSLHGRQKDGLCRVGSAVMARAFSISLVRARTAGKVSH
jgi:hypothetical protein